MTPSNFIQYKHLRAIIFAVIFALLYLLFLRWNDFNAERSTLNSPSQTTQNQSGQGVGSPDNPQDEVAGSPPGDIDLLPKADIEPASTTNAALELSHGVDSARFVSIKTDVMRVVIDLNGGDLVASQLYKYTKSQEDKTPLHLFQHGERNYTVNSGFIGEDGVDSNAQRALYTSDKPSYTLTDDQQTLRIVLMHQAEGMAVQKELLFTRGSYQIEQNFIVNNTSTTPKKIAIYSHIRRGLFGDDYDTLQGFGVSSYLGAALSTPNDSYQKVTFDDIQDDNLNARAVSGWVAMLQHYFVTALVPPQDQMSHFYTRYSNANALLGYRTDVFVVAPEQSHTTSTRIYSGPKIKSLLEPVQANLPLTIDYGWFWFISELLMWLLLKLQTYFINWGASIVMLTVIVRLAFFWPTKKAFYSMARMRLAMPQIEAIKSRVGDDKQALSREVMAFYKKEKLNPIGGCLPMLLQMPVFIALYWGLLESVELRHAPFMLWIQDLSAPDPYFILPILMGITFFLQQHLNPQAATMDPMMKQVMRWMPVVFTVLFLWLPSGLVLYFVTSNSWSIIQQYIITKQLEKQQKHG